MGNTRSPKAWLRRTTLTAFLVIALTAVACSSSPSDQAASTSGPAAGGAGEKSPAAPSARGGKASVSSTAAPGAPAPTSAPVDGTDSTTDDADDPSTAAGSYHGGPPPANFPFKSKVPVHGSIDPLCVTPGSAVTLTVTTKPEAAVIFNAVYEDGYGGGPPPYGKGYGGNDKGFSGPDGRFSATWVVARDAPPGRGRVDVIVGHSGKWGYEGPHFGVADADGRCPKEWLTKTDHAGDGDE